MQNPHFELAEIQRLAAEWKIEKKSGWFSAPSCSTDYVIHVFQCSEIEAVEIILEGISMLKLEDFQASVMVWDDVADEYGLCSYLGRNWYVKLRIDDDNVLNEISFHPCEKDMQLPSGRILTVSIAKEDLPPWRKVKK